MFLLPQSLTQATPYLVAVHLHDRCPSSITTSKISHVTEHGCWLWVKGNCNHLCFACRRQRRRHFLVNNRDSETCIRRTLEHFLRVSKHAGFHCLHKKNSFPTLPSTKALVAFQTNSNKKDLYENRITYSSRFSWCQSWHDLIAEKNDQIH